MTRLRTPCRPGVPSRLALSIASSIALASAAPAVLADDYLAGLDAAGRAEFEASNGLATINAQYAYARGLDGRGIVAGVFDTGVSPDSPGLRGRVRGLVSGALAPDGSPCPDSARLRGPNRCLRVDGARPQVNYLDWDLAQFQVRVPGAPGEWLEENIAWGRYAAHGTHVAGIVGAARDGVGTHGVAPAAELVAARLDADSYRDMAAFFQEPGGVKLEEEASRAGFAEAVQGAIDAGARVLNHSWGFVADAPRDRAEADAQYSRFADKLDALAEGSRRGGMLQVVAAGNNSGGVAATPADLPNYLPDITPYWVSVVSATADGALDGFSSICGTTAAWCLAAPGNQILSTVVGGKIDAAPTRDAAGNVIGVAVAARQRPEFEDFAMSGTSQAAPHVTGALVLLMQRFPYLDNAQVRDVMLTTARDLGAPGVDEVFGWGMLDLRKAIDGPGMLRVDTTVRMDRPGGGTPAWDAPAWDEWRNAIEGPGRLVKEGAGWLRLTGDNRFAGATVSGGTLEFTGDNALSGEVAATAGGMLRVAGRLAGSDVSLRGGRAWIGGEIAQARVQVLPEGELHVDATGRINGGMLSLRGGNADIDGRVDGPVDIGRASRLSGDGTLGPTLSAGTIAPGHSLGTLTINGDYLQQASGVYEAELGPSGTSDLLQVNGQARLQGGTLWLGDPGVGAALGQRWRVLAATGGVEGGFTAVDGYKPATPFLDILARYSINAVEVEVARGLPLASAATTRNGRSVATAVDLGADADPLVQRLTQLMPAQLPAALAPLDGELHASLRSLLLQDTQLLRDAALARTRNGQDAFTAQMLPGGSEGFWADVQQRRRRLDGDGNAGAAELGGGTMLAGYDHRFDSGWQLGVLGGAGEASARLRDRQDRADVHATYLGLQASRAWQALAWRMGAGYSWQGVRSRRDSLDSMATPTTATARYNVDTLQWFTELGYRFEGRVGGVEPFLQYAGLRLRSDAAQEQGGIAPLSIQRATQDVGLWTGGLRFGLDLSSRGQSERWLSLRGGLAYQQANGELTPAASMQWQDGAPFTTWGAPLARRSALASLGLAARLTPHSLLELDWRGAFADNVRDNGIGARYSIRF